VWGFGGEWSKADGCRWSAEWRLKRGERWGSVLSVGLRCFRSRSLGLRCGGFIFDDIERKSI